MNGHGLRRGLLYVLLFGAAACGSSPPRAESTPGESVLAGLKKVPNRVYDAIPRDRFNQLAVVLNLPLYFRNDDNGNGAADPNEVVPLLFYPTVGAWSRDGHFTPAFDQAYELMLAEEKSKPEGATPEETARLALLREELAQGRPTLIHWDFQDRPAHEREFVVRMIRTADHIDALYAKQTGVAALSGEAPVDSASQSVMRRNWGPSCVAPKTEDNRACTAVPGYRRAPVDVYPSSLQKDPEFCKELESHEKSEALRSPFTVVRREGEALTAVPYTTAYREGMARVATELEQAAQIMEAEPAEGPLRDYLRAAAKAFRTNDWEPADEAWAQMNATNSRFYVRVAPDEVYWDPCSNKAGFHVTFARIDPGSRKWQERLSPLRDEMEASVAKLAGPAYRPRRVSFHLPDFIEIILNAGDDRSPLGATIGQSLPNWGKIASEGRGRTVTMTNLYTDVDSRAILRTQAASLLDPKTFETFVDDEEPNVLTTILHEAAHNLGPSHEYAYRKKTAAQAFGGGMASMLEELKAQSAALYFLPFLEAHGIISGETREQAYVRSLVWSFGHIARGMVTPSGQPKPYSQLSAIQLGALMDAGAVTWDAAKKAANGTDTGAFVIHFDEMDAAVTETARQVLKIKATNDVNGAKTLMKKYVEGDRVPMDVIRERITRQPKASFVYAIDLERA